MKTQEKIKSEIVSYLTKTAVHTFIKPKATFKWAREGSHYEYDYNDFTYFKVIEKEGGFFRLEKTGISDYKMYKIDIEDFIKYYGNNSKCVVSNLLFLDKKMKSVKSNKYHLGEIEKILEVIK
jgi:hypothetical protein